MVVICDEDISIKTHTFAVIAVGRGTSLTELTYLGLLGIRDPPREGVRMSVEVLHQTGVKVKMVTGDAQETAVAVAQSVGLSVSGKMFMISHFTGGKLLLLLSTSFSHRQ